MTTYYLYHVVQALNLTAHKQRVKLRQRGSLANRRKPSRSSLRALSSHCMYDVIPSDVTYFATGQYCVVACVLLNIGCCFLITVYPRRVLHFLSSEFLRDSQSKHCQ